MNTRLQVEHPVTEMVTGLDLVKLQIRDRAGRAAALRAGRPARSAATPSSAASTRRTRTQGFLPSPGRIAALRVPGGPGRPRRLAASTKGYEVPVHYDPLLSQAGGLRRRPRRRPSRACGARSREYTVLGHQDHAALLRARAAPPGLRGRRLRHRLRGARVRGRPTARGRGPWEIGGGRGRDRAPSTSGGARAGAAGRDGAARSAWRARGLARACGREPPDDLRRHRRRPHRARRGARRGRAATRSRSTAGRWRSTSSDDRPRTSLSLIVDGRSHEAGIERRPGGYTVVLARATRSTSSSRRRRAGRRRRAARAAAGPARVKAPMPGKIVRVLVAPGQAGAGRAGPGGDGSHEDGERAQRAARRAGRGVHVREGQAVETGALLVVLE